MEEFLQINNITGDRINVTELVDSLQKFNLYDFSIFVLIIVSCIAIGLFFAIRDKLNSDEQSRRRATIELDYLIGGRQMKVIPIAMSLLASCISGITMLGMSMEMYVFGTELAFIMIGIGIAAYGVHHIFIPVYSELKLTSVNHYLEERFDKRVRFLSGAIFILTALVWTPITIYAPAIAFNQVTGINIYLVAVIVGIICTFYTTLGGIKAVVWIDVIQTCVICITLFVIAIKGTINLGGFTSVMSRNYEGGRIDIPDVTLDPTVRHSLFAIVIGGGFYYVQFLTSQTFILRYMSLPNVNAVKQSFLLFIIGLMIIMLVLSYDGLLIYARYYDCDPVATKLVKANEQLFPILVMEIFHGLPGMTGLFVAGLFSGALSLVSTTLNAISAVVLQDFVKRAIPRLLPESTTNYIMRSVVLVAGLICIGLIFLIEKIGPTLQLSMSVLSCGNGALLAIFIMGLTMPWINGKSAFTGGVAGVIVIIVIASNAEIDELAGEILYPGKAISTDGCEYNFELSNSTARLDKPRTTFFRHNHISYLWFVCFGAIISIGAAWLSTLVFGRQDPEDIDHELLAPFVRTYFRARSHRNAKKSVQLDNYELLARNSRDTRTNDMTDP